ncbi:MFS transporter [Actinocatenispora sera]|uniref:MFS transporter n=1 Tax=Actinocatenispora sera TaxID=390989 RepID=A0A810KT46_9ACTN|nr:MFS transporter [Actinocatenispora sera]BCJ26114.1 MFS transporter [Actinocatenispora sera]
MTSTRTGPARTDRTTGGARLVLALICACQFMVILDSAIVNVALPSVGTELRFTPTGLTWVVNGYLLTFAGLMLIGGRAADVFGPRRVLLAGLALFSVASLVGGLAPVPGVLVAARGAQGVGAALLAPATLAVINTGFTEAGSRARAFGAWSAAGGIGGTAGALAGGVITTGLSWRWIFLINVPIGALLIAVAATALPAVRPHGRPSLDLVGAITGTAGLAALVYGVMGAADHGWRSAWVLGPGGAGLVLLVVFTVVQARIARRPLLPLRIFAVRGTAVGTGMLVLFGGVVMAMWYFTSLLLQNVLGYSALRAGLGQTPAAVAFLLVARATSGLLPRIGARRSILAGAGLLLVGFGWLARADAGTGYLTGVLGPTLLVAVGIGLVFPTVMAVATADAPERDAGVAGGVATTANQVGSSIGLAVLATAASAVSAADRHPGSPAALAGGYDRVFLAAAGLAVGIAVLSVLLPRRARR